MESKVWLDGILVEKRFQCLRQELKMLAEIGDVRFSHAFGRRKLDTAKSINSLPPPTMQADPQTAAAVQAAIKGFTDKYQARTLNDLMAGIAPDADVVFYGTGKDERRQGLDEICSQIQRDWSQTETMRLSFSPGPISAAGPVAWTAMEGVCHFRTAGQNLSWPLRVSFVFENRSGQWLMAHAHFSTPAAGQDEGSSI